MKNNYVKLLAKSNKEKQLLSNVINEITEEERNERTELWFQRRKNNEIVNSEVLEYNTDIYSDYDDFEKVTLINQFKVETTFVSGYGNFLWNVPKNTFQKTPLRHILRDDPIFEKIDEEFKIEFVCEEVLLSKDEILNQFEEWYEHREPSYNIYSKKKIIDISFNVRKNSSLTYSQLLFSLINETDLIHWGLRKDLITYPCKYERQHFPYDLEKSFKLAYKKLDNDWSEPSPMKDYFIEIINSQNWL